MWWSDMSVNFTAARVQQEVGASRVDLEPFCQLLAEVSKKIYPNYVRFVCQFFFDPIHDGR